MMKLVRRLITISSITFSAAACAPQAPLVTSIDTLCVSTSRYHATAEQKAVYVADKITIEKNGVTTVLGAGEAIFGSMVRWFGSFNKVRDGQCLTPAGGN